MNGELRGQSDGGRVRKVRVRPRTHKRGNFRQIRHRLSTQPGRWRPYRAKVLDLQTAADRVVRSTCASVGQRVIDIPPNMTTDERVRWIAARVTRLGITRDTPAALGIPAVR